MSFLKKLLSFFFCRHEWEDKCGVKMYDGRNWQDVCQSRKHNGNCRSHDENYNLFPWFCDFYYQKCKKCGKRKD